MMRPDFRDPRLLLLASALILTLLALAAPSAPIKRKSFDTLVVVDITGSMNTRDYSASGRPISRLEFVKATLRDFLAGLPCASHVGLGVFSERRSFLLFEPVEVCENYASLAGAIEALDWRMAWEGDSRIGAGLFRAIETARELKTDLVFLTDGQEAPPLPFSGPPPFEGCVGEVRGLVVGVGGYELAPIPKFDDTGREIGFYSVEDVPHDNRFGLPPPGAEQREGHNARNAPFGGTVALGVEHLSSVREDYLKSLAEKTGLSYAHLSDSPRLLDAFETVATPQHRVFAVSLRPLFGATAGVSLIAVFILLPAFAWLAEQPRRQARNVRKQQKGNTHENTLDDSRDPPRFSGPRAWSDAHQGR
jgi:mxaL protein